jgi:hypothetical protein
MVMPIRPGGGHSSAVESDNRRVPAPQAFLPSVDGFAFVNSWPSQPAVELPTPFGLIAVGDAAAGLCGGMVFAALDYWHAGAVASTAQPSREDRLYRYIVRRLVESWHVPAGVAQYYQWMNLPDADTGFNAFGHRIIVERGLAWRTIGVQLPAVRADLDLGLPVPLGVVTAASFSRAVVANACRSECRDSRSATGRRAWRASRRMWAEHCWLLQAPGVAGSAGGREQRSGERVDADAGRAARIPRYSSRATGNARSRGCRPADVAG